MMSVATFDERVIGLCSEGTTTGEVTHQLQVVSGTQVSQDLVSG